MPLRNITIQPKPEREKNEERDVHKKSSAILAYNLYEQDWQTLIDEGLTHLFASEAEFMRQKGMKINYEKLPQPR